jgi:DNA mismatch repair protein MutS
MLGRYAELKAQLPEGTILFYQVGTFFETFEEDAKKISQALSIRLTSREAAGYAGGRVPLAGVPNHALEEHTGTLLRKGTPSRRRAGSTRPSPSSSRGRSPHLTPGTVIETTCCRRRVELLAPSYRRTGGRASPGRGIHGEFTGPRSPRRLAAELNAGRPGSGRPRSTAAEDLPKSRHRSAPRPLDLRAVRGEQA